MPARWLLPLLAIALRVGVALADPHVEFDVRVMFAMRRALLEHGLHAYGDVPEWVYPPGLMPWLLIGTWLADHLGISREFALRLPSILADGALTFLVMAALESKRTERGLVIVAGSLVAFGPMFVAVSSYQGQIDTLAVLPAAVAALVWGGTTRPSRAVVCGLLIGIGAALKTVPIFVTLALLPTACSWRERASLVMTTAAVPALMLLPFLAVDPGGAGRVFQYAGLPGLGGWSVLIQPSLTRSWLLREPFDIARSTQFLYLCGAVASLIGLVLVTLLLIRRRTPPLAAAPVVWLTVYALAVGFFPQYTTWALPFFLMAGRIRESAILSALLMPITVIVVLPRPLSLSGLVPVYQAFAVAMQLFFVVMWVRSLVATDPDGFRTPPNPPAV